jgi:hypothetical protein
MSILHSQQSRSLLTLAVPDASDLAAIEASRKVADAAHKALEEYREWMKEKQDQGWTWDSKAQAFFRVGATGEKAWYQNSQD